MYFKMGLGIHLIMKVFLLRFITNIAWILVAVRAEDDCAFLRVRQEEHFITSHSSFPDQPYENGIDQCWVLQLGDGYYRILLKLYTFKIQYSANCQRDYLEIRDGTEAYHPWRGRYCNTFLPETIESEGQSLYLRFHTDDSIQDTGFQIGYLAVEDDSYEDYYIPEYDPLIPDLDLGENSVTVDTDSCVEILLSYPREDCITSHAGYGSANYPKNYQKCWKIRLVPSSPLTAVQLVNTGDFDLDSKDDCVGDHLIVYNGLTLDSQVIGIFCNAGYGFKSVQSEGGTDMLAVFQTDDTQEGAGFKLQCESVDSCGHLKAMESPQNFYSHDEYGYRDYASNLDSCWTIEPSALVQGQNSIIVIQNSFMSIHSTTNCQEDYVKIWDGRMGSADELGTYCRNHWFNIVRSSSRDMYITFHTDGNTESLGFNFSYWTESFSTPDEPEVITGRAQEISTTMPIWMTLVIAVVGSLVGLFILAAVIAGIVYLVWRLRKNERESEMRPRLTQHEVTPQQRVTPFVTGNVVEEMHKDGVTNPSFITKDDL